ncbi:MAG: hypothetical protein ABI614_15030, partial [Planctomycetota bacterium]
CRVRSTSRLRHLDASSGTMNELCVQVSCFRLRLILLFLNHIAAHQRVFSPILVSRRSQSMFLILTIRAQVAMAERQLFAAFDAVLYLKASNPDEV